MNVLIRRDGPCTVIRPVGDLDLSTEPRLRVELEALLSSPETPCLVMDLTQVPFCDSSGLGLLVHTMTRVRDARGRLVLVVPEGMISHVLTLTHLDQHFEIYETVQAAQDSFQTAA